MLNKTTKKLKKLTSHPEQYLIIQNEKAEKLKETVKNLYDVGKAVQVESQSKTSALQELVIDQMDEEQIWQQMEINNEEFLAECLGLTSNMLSINQLKLDLPYEKVVDESESMNGDHDEAGSDEEDRNEDEEVKQRQKKKKKGKKGTKKKSSIVDDKFFNLSEMEAFLEQEDKKEMKKGKKRDEEDESDIDYFEDPGESDDSEADREQNLKYSEYFDPEDESEAEEGDSEEEEVDEDNSKRRVKFDLSRNTEATFNSDPEQEDENEQEEEEQPESDTEKSAYERRQEALRKTIDRLEEKALQDKHWQLKGEITAQSRPENALLEEFLEFDAATRPAPIITEQTTMQLEDIVKQRVKDRAFDDVVRKVKPSQSVQEYRKTLVLDSEKSKESLAQIYEKEFLKAAEKLDPDADDKQEEEPKEHKEIRKSLKSLFAKLDALSNYHITPRPAAPEVKIITNTPAISMEEVAPITMSNAALLAPEEVKQKTKGDTILTKEEMTKTDRNRNRREKRLKQKLKKKQQEEKQAALEKSGKLNKKLEQKKAMTQVMKNRNVEKMKQTKGVNITSSSTFFSKLQEENAATGNKKKALKKKKMVETLNGISAKALKL